VTPECTAAQALEAEEADALLAAAAEAPAQLDPPAHQETPATQEAQDSQEAPASRPRTCAPLPPQPHASPALAASLAHQAHQDQLETQEAQDSPARAVATPLPAHQAHRDQLETQEAQDSQGVQDSREHLLSPSREARDHQDPQEMLEDQDSQDSPDSPEAQDSQEAQDPRDHQDPQASQETMDTPEAQDSQASQAVVARRASAPSTVPSMEESSLRTEPDAKRHSRSFPPHPPFDSRFPPNFIPHCHVSVFILERLTAPLSLVLMATLAHDSGFTLAPV